MFFTLPQSKSLRCASFVFMAFIGMAAHAQPAIYQQECAGCHVAYPAGMLPAASWKNVMNTLSKHFGTDASLDSAAQRDISSWLQNNAGTYKRVSEEPPQNRITQSAWFLRKHRAGEVPADVWKRPAVGSPSNCSACHANAAKGNFNEHEVRIPR
jgi:mono/diheme cytochrome c family protein